MATDDATTAPARADDVDLNTIGADVPEGSSVLLVTEIDLPDDKFTGQWTDEDTVSRIFDGDVCIRLERSDPVFKGVVDAELILAHDGQLLPVVRVRGSSDWAQELRTSAATIMTLHTDLESGVRCRQHAGAEARTD